jgi:hypothetical protein
MSVRARFAILCGLAIHLAVASMLCPTPSLPARAHERDALAGASVHPCPGHPTAEPTSWLDAACPCGCGDRVPLGGATAQSGPALLLVAIDPLPDSERTRSSAPPQAFTQLALSPPEPVPLSIA